MSNSSFRITFPATASFSLSSSYALMAEQTVSSSYISLNKTSLGYKSNFSESIWIGKRTDNISGSGTYVDPYDGSTCDKFDYILRRYWSNGSQSLEVNILPGIYETRGNYDYYNYGSQIENKGWRAHNNWKIQGSGIDVTVLKLTGSDCILSGSGYGALQALAVSCGPDGEYTGQSVKDLTIDGNYTQISASYAPVGVNVGAVGFRGTNHNISDIKVINVACKNGNEGFPIFIDFYYEGTGKISRNNVIDNVKAYVLDGWMTAISIGSNNNNNASSYFSAISGRISNCYVEAPDVSTHDIIGYGGFALDGVVYENNVSRYCDYGVNIDTFRNRNLVFKNNKFLANQSYGIICTGGATSSLNEWPTENVLVDGNVFEQRSNTTAITLIQKANNFIITNNSFLSTGSSATNITFLDIRNSTSAGFLNGTGSRNVSVRNNYFNTSSYSDLTTYSTVDNIMYEREGHFTNLLFAKSRDSGSTNAIRFYKDYAGDYQNDLGLIYFQEEPVDSSEFVFQLGDNPDGSDKFVFKVGDVNIRPVTEIHVSGLLNHYSSSDFGSRAVDKHSFTGSMEVSSSVKVVGNITSSGFILPQAAPITALLQTGSMYVDFAAAKIYIFNGTIYLTASLTS